MGLTRLGANLIAAMLVGEATKDFNSTGAVIVVGSSTAAYSATSTFLEAAYGGGGPNRFATMDATYPSRSTGQLSFRATFGSTYALMDWREWGVYNSSASGVDGTLINRKMEEPSLGTKSTSQTWQFLVTLTSCVGS